MNTYKIKEPDRETVELFALLNNTYERQHRKIGYKSYRERMNNESILKNYDFNVTELVTATIHQLKTIPEYFKLSDIKDLVQSTIYTENKNRVLIVKVTHACNLFCPYCYNRYNNHADSCSKMSIETIKRILEVFNSDGKLRQFIFHGGEPLLMGIDFYRTVLPIIRAYGDIEISMQTNATLLTQEFIDLFKHYDVKPGISFDGLTNDKTRKNTGLLMKKLNLMFVNDMNTGAIRVFDETNVKDIIEEYEYFKRLKLGASFNYMFKSIGNDHSHFLNADLWAESVCKLFDYWIHDKRNPINVTTLGRYINAAFNEPHVCANTDCVGLSGWFSIYPDGSVFNCGRDGDVNGHPAYCNISEVSSINDIISTSNRQNFYCATRKLMESCKQCEYYNGCYSGCFMEAYIHSSSLNEPEPNYCRSHKKILGHIISTVLELKREDYPNLNYLFIEQLNKLGFRNFDIINTAYDLINQDRMNEHEKEDVS